VVTIKLRIHHSPDSPAGHNADPSFSGLAYPIRRKRGAAKLRFSQPRPPENPSVLALGAPFCNRRAGIHRRVSILGLGRFRGFPAACHIMENTPADLGLGRIVCSAEFRASSWRIAAVPVPSSKPCKRAHRTFPDLGSDRAPADSQPRLPHSLGSG
jgi:hypothetical protein